MRLANNLLAGFANSIWTAVVTLAVVPLYIQYLGIESYGLVGFYATTQALFLILDLGLAPTMNREVARCSATGDMRDARFLLRTLTVLYWSIAGGIALVVVLLAPSIASHWLQTINLTHETVTHAVMLMGMAIACRWPIGLYQGALMGSQRLAISSGINMAMVSLANFGAIAILAWISPTILAFFVWHASVGLLHTVIMRRAAWSLIGRSRDARFDIRELRRVWHFSAGMSGVAIAALVLTQLDKLILSRIVNLEDLGRYTLAGVVASALYVLTTPVFNAIFPHFTTLVRKSSVELLARHYRMGTLSFSTIIFPVACAIAAFSKDLIFVWTGNADLAATTAPIAGLLVLGTSINGVMHFPYALQLAYGVAWLPLTISLILVVLLVPLIILLVMSYGVTGGAAAWLALNGMYLVLGAWLTHRYLLRGLGPGWLMRDVCFPLAVSVLVIWMGEAVLTHAGVSGDRHYVRILSAAGLTCLTVLVILLLSPRLRKWVADYVRSNEFIAGTRKEQP